MASVLGFDQGLGPLLERREKDILAVGFIGTCLLRDGGSASRLVSSSSSHPVAWCPSAAAFGQAHVVLVDSDGKLYGFGNNAHGQACPEAMDREVEVEEPQPIPLLVPGAASVRRAGQATRSLTAFPCTMLPVVSSSPAGSGRSRPVTPTAWRSLPVTGPSLHGAWATRASLGHPPTPYYLAHRHQSLGPGGTSAYSSRLDPTLPLGALGVSLGAHGPTP